MKGKGTPYIDHGHKKGGKTSKGPNVKSYTGSGMKNYRSPKGKGFDATVGNPHNHKSDY